MKTMPPIDARVRLSAAAIEKLAKSKGRARDPGVVGVVVGQKGARATVRWPGAMPDEALPPVYLELEA